MCKELKVLIEEYERAVSLFSATLAAYQESLATSPRHEYVRIRNYVEQARAKSEEAKARVDRHIKEHGCQERDDANGQSA